ncbi:predicted protein [Histoplasma capsulatum G186AR]|uniref:Uncharacterized protein n=1 Tax=Ajellomyces capsulatus (strain G186AR / H82 / ATCC MYA-2454 / RMSCC 2432) TaxID=447093 RepID=C0NJ80_AJECG|nr:uncharacterized protein HCBG_03210 [Histoplasma capsulatum G186AR]EEH07921.1 predicted protein [Histoplasma capsulatum G186AR]
MRRGWRRSFLNGAMRLQRGAAPELRAKAATEEPRQPILAGANIAFSSGFAWPGTEAKNEGATCAGAGDERTPGGLEWGIMVMGDGRWAMGELRMEATDEGGLRSTKPSSAQSMRMKKR